MRLIREGSRVHVYLDSDGPQILPPSTFRGSYTVLHSPADVGDLWHLRNNRTGDVVALNPNSANFAGFFSLAAEDEDDLAPERKALEIISGSNVGVIGTGTSPYKSCPYCLEARRIAHNALGRPFVANDKEQV